MSFGNGVGIFAAICFGAACTVSYFQNGINAETVALWAAAQASITAV